MDVYTRLDLYVYGSTPGARWKLLGSPADPCGYGETELTSSLGRLLLGRLPPCSFPVFCLHLIFSSSMAEGKVFVCPESRLFVYFFFSLGMRVCTCVCCGLLRYASSHQERQDSSVGLQSPTASHAVGGPNPSRQA